MRLHRGGLRGSLCRRLFIRRQQAVNFAGWNAIATFSATNQAATEFAFTEPEANGLLMDSQEFCCLRNRDEPVRHSCLHFPVRVRERAYAKAYMKLS